MKITNRFYSWIGAILLVILVLSGCEEQKSRKTLRLAEASQPAFALVYIADVNGYFEDEGLDVTFDAYTSGRDALNSVVAGKNDIATVFITPIVLQAYAGQQLSVITQLHSSTGNTGLVARRDMGISEAADIKGKKIGVPVNTTADFFLELFLTGHGLSRLDVTIVDIEPQNMAEALEKGEVDAVTIWYPHLKKIHQSFPTDETITFYSDGVGTSYSDVYMEFSYLALLEKTANDKAEAIDRLMRGLLRAEKFLKANPDEALEIATSRLPKSIQHLVSNSWKNFDLQLKLNNVMLSTFIAQADWFRARGRFTEDTPDFRKIMKTAFLKKIQPEKVTLDD